MIAGFLFILGLLVGSFANVLSDRLPKGEDVLWGRSHCDYCRKTLRWYELIPVVSYFFQRGRCLRCKKKLSLQYPIVELVSGTGFVLLNVAQVHPAYYILFLSFLVIFIADFKFQIIPDSMIIVGAVATIWTGIHLIPAIGGCAFLYILWLITRKRGIGFGDVKFAFLMGLFLGFPGVVMAFYVAFLTGAFVGVILMIGRKKTWKSKIAFGPFLVLGTVTAAIYQTQFLALWRMFV